ncbi:hypothetical protein [Methylobacterium sp. J-070]|uniref:hypothetical protein n=1 Tax=Methylobacterium sp. J-070 TaxID=2836650 RepID=UPI001FBB5E6C|nr:hypothetical protein [Methylobacterium sp. J-070]MCJ2050870.1 hypothetical protein [Methylobacterium sp. J-070]
MADFANPEPVLQDIADFFADAAREGGVSLDPVLCGAFAEGLRDAAACLRTVLDRAETAGLLERLRPPATGSLEAGPPPRRTRAERLGLARLAVALDPEGRVLAFPAPNPLPRPAHPETHHGEG